MVSSRKTANTEQPTIFIELAKKTNENGQKLNILFFCKTSRNASMLEQGTVVLSYDS